MSVRSGVRGWGHTSRTGSGSGTVTFAAPVLSWVSGTSVRDPVFSSTLILTGDNVELQVDDNSDFSSTYGDDTHTVTALEAADGQISSSIPTLAYSTTYYARVRYQRLGVWSGWSNTVSKTMDAATPTKLVIGTGVTGAGNDRSQYINSSDGLTYICNADVGAACLERSVTAPPNQFHFELTIVAVIAGSRLAVGVSDSALALGAAVFSYPGTTGGGAVLQMEQTSTSWVLHINGGTTAVTAPNVLAAGDLISFDVDKTAKTLLIKHKRGGTTTTLGTYTLTSLIPTNWTATVGAGAANGDSGTINFGATSFAVTPQSGFVGW